MKTHGSLQNLLSPAVISLPRPQLTWSKCWINWEFILSNLIISVILSNTANHWNPLWNLTNVPLGPANTPLHSLSSVSSRNLSPSTDIWGHHLHKWGKSCWGTNPGSPQDQKRANPAFPFIPAPVQSQCLSQARKLAQAVWFPALGEALWMWRWSNADTKLL